MGATEKTRISLNFTSSRPEDKVHMVGWLSLQEDSESRRLENIAQE